MKTGIPSMATTKSIPTFSKSPAASIVSYLPINSISSRNLIFPPIILPVSILNLHPVPLHALKTSQINGQFLLPLLLIRSRGSLLLEELRIDGSVLLERDGDAADGAEGVLLEFATKGVD